MNEPYTGGCACGAIRYAISATPIFQNNCQCRDCQRRSGTGHGSYLTFADRQGVVLQGNASHWAVAADSGHLKTSGFCPACGSPVYMTFSEMPKVFAIHAASLDDPGRFRPQAVTYHSRRLHWDHLGPELRKFERMVES